MRIHLIAIGGAVMHNLALALQQNGHDVTGSDDEIYDPARSRLSQAGLLPTQEGWDASRITEEIELVVLGMHAKSDNPELLRAMEFGIRVVSFPEYIGEVSRDKTRIVIAGSHGKTTTTSMIMHVLRDCGIDFDYLVGAQLDGFETMVSITDAPVMVIEGDEYLSSCLDRRSKFVHYDPDVLVLTGIAWDHINVFRTEEEYIGLFRGLMDSLRQEARVYYDNADVHLQELLGTTPHVGYEAFETDDAGCVLIGGQVHDIEIFGRHNMANMRAAFYVCQELGVGGDRFLTAMSTFKGANKRLEKMRVCGDVTIYRDYAHAPSKLRASMRALRERYSDRPLHVVFELHTYSSLNRDFLPRYKGCLDHVDQAIVFYSDQTLRIKGMEALSEDGIRDSFGRDNLVVAHDSESLAAALEGWATQPKATFVWASSGHFGGLDMNKWNDAWCDA